MIVNYSKLNTLETPILTLCNPGCTYDKDTGKLSNAVGILSNTEAEEIIYNFNSQSELNFRINCISNFTDEGLYPKDKRKYVLEMYKGVENRRLIFIDEIGFFVIKNVKEHFEGGMRYKDVSASSVEEELTQKTLPYIEDGTYRFNDIFDMVLSVLPLWKKGEVSDLLSNKSRTFESVEPSTNCLGFLLEDMQDAYECIFVFDPLTRAINVYDQEDYISKNNARTNIIITNEDLVNSIDMEDDSSDIYTAIRAIGSDNNSSSIVISAVNPTGENVIYNFQHYKNWMSSSLKTKVESWEAEIEASSNKEDNNSYYKLNEAYYTKLKELAECEQDIDAINTKIDKYTRCRNNVSAEKDKSLVEKYLGNDSGINTGEGVDYEGVIRALNEKISEFDNTKLGYIGNRTMLENSIRSSEEQIKDIKDSLNTKAFFNESELKELNNYIFEGQYTDEHVTFTDSMDNVARFEQMALLYDRAKAQLQKSSVPTQKFSVNVESFVFSKEFEVWSKDLKTGCVIAVEQEPGEIADLFLLSITINYDDKQMSLTFGNRYNKYDMQSLFQDMLGKISKSANTLSFVKELTTPLKNNGLNEMKESIKAARRLTTDYVIASDNQEVIIDDSGYLGRRKRTNTDNDYEDEQIKITHKNIAFTNDNWSTSGLVMGEINLPDGGGTKYGINAEHIVGEMIVGADLEIKDGSNQKIISTEGGVVKIFGKSRDDFGSVDSVVTPDNSYEFSDNGMIISGATEVQCTDNLTVNSGMATTLHKAVGAAGAEIGALYIKNSDGTLGERLEQASAVGAGKFTYAPDTKVLRFFTDVVDGTKIEVRYARKNDIGVTSNRVNSGGMVVSRAGDDETAVLTADYNGVNALNLTSRQYLIIGDHSRFENFFAGEDGSEKRTACYFIGNLGGDE